MSTWTVIPALDGLRALAIIFVLLYHAGFSWFTGGFIGVDVFFVLSGFLITGTIAADVAAGRMTLRRFYVRRMARLLPALFVTIAATMAVGPLILSPGERAALARSAVASALSVGNVLFWLEDDYFAASAATKPLLHTWSLGVEEQFYLVWPVLLITLLKRSKRAAVWGVAVVGAASLAAALWWSNRAPSAVFYLMPFRGYGLAAGGLLALLGLGTAPAKWLTWTAWAGVALLVAAGTLGHISGIVPVIATVAFLTGVRQPAVDRFWALPVLTWLGKRSYSIYLAHWPLMVLWRLHWGAGSGLTPWMLIAASVFVGALLSTLVEHPFRLHGNATQWQTRRSLAAVGVSFAAVIGIALLPRAMSQQTQPSPQAVTRVEAPRDAGTSLPAVVAVGARPAAAALNPPVESETGPAAATAASATAATAASPFVAPVAVRARDQVMLESARANDASKQARADAVFTGVCSLSVDKAQIAAYMPERCASGPVSRQRYLVLGDSWAGDTYLIFSRAYPDVYFGVMSVPGCRLRPPEDIAEGEQSGCRSLYAYALETLSDPSRFDGVILSSSWDPPYERVAALADALAARGLRVIVVGQHATFERAVPDFALAAGDVEGANAMAARLAQPFRREQDRQLRGALSAGTVFVDFLSLHCPSGSCDIIDPAGALLYIDTVHVSLRGAEIVADRLLRAHPHLFK